ncbi:hypothetical protein QBC37DRAFT_407122 [Rhypophila decipiens]|uniref:Uncharacterized protein n=1 Tax=Rhypophila decipiens TaxID=261697 RepID=A0AAN6XT63_9PEZI|nr:hypothetical protein QBC37DRAFT_407122 [Rhypophila decipiens]
MLAATKCWPPQNAGRHKMLAATKCWPPQNAGRHEMLAATKCWPPQNAGRHKMLAATKCWPPEYVGRHGMLAATSRNPPAARPPQHPDWHKIPTQAASCHEVQSRRKFRPEAKNVSGFSIVRSEAIEVVCISVCCVE